MLRFPRVPCGCRVRRLDLEAVIVEDAQLGAALDTNINKVSKCVRFHVASYHGKLHEPLICRMVDACQNEVLYTNIGHKYDPKAARGPLTVSPGIGMAV